LWGNTQLFADGLRGTRIAKGRLTMNTSLIEEAPTPESTACDWLATHGDYLFNFAVGQVRDANVAEDLVQETFLAALKSYNRFGGKSSERTWLIGILRHKICDHLRRVCRERPARENPLRARNEEAWDESLLWQHEVSTESIAPSRRMELAEFREALEGALGHLPPRLAQVFKLYEIEEQPNPAVCARLQISESNLWVMLHRARKQLRNDLAEWNDSRRQEQAGLFN
jgi:RNA polymerase sigma-70 factor (ECF subfamily)